LKSGDAVRRVMRAPPPGSGTFGEDLGMFVLAERDDGSVEVALDAGAEHHREGGIVHGGVMMTLLDSAMAAAVRRTLTPGQWIASASITTDFLAAAKEGRLVARGWVERRGKLSAFPRGELRDSTGALVARASGVWAIR
jgi:uncharacterized protein (TIGR00369 family)